MWCISNTPRGNTHISPFKVLTGFNMRIKTQPELRKLLEEFIVEELDMERENFHPLARDNISHIQTESRETSNRQKNEAPKYSIMIWSE